MKIFKTLLCLTILFVVMTGCAASYHEINPPTLTYKSDGGAGDAIVNFEYKYDLLNQKYAKKEIKFGVKLVAVKITNNTGRDLAFGKDLKITYTNGNEVSTLEKADVFNTLKQQTPFYLFYMLLTATTFNTSSGSGSSAKSSSVPIGLAIGPGLTLINMLIAGSANTNFNAELTKYTLVNTTIKNGTTVYGLIGIKEGGYEALKIKVQ